jgi:hypothetical protein
MTNQIVFYDDASIEPFSLDKQLRAQYGPHRHIETLPLFTVIASGGGHDVGLTIIRVVIDGRYRHQLYAIDRGTWSLVGIFGLYTDTMRDLLRWRDYIEGGGTIRDWQLTHPDGIYPERSGFAA